MTEDSPEPSDRALVAGVLAGDSSSVEAFVERMRCVPRILGARNARGGRALSPEDLADLAQEVFSTVWRKLPDYRGEARLEAWVYPFCQLQYMNALRRTTRRRLRQDPVPGSEGEERAEPVSEAPERELDPLDSALVHAALARLSEAERGVIRLKQFEELTFDAIATRLGLSVNTAKTRYYRGLAHLRDLLATRFEDVGAPDAGRSKEGAA